MIEAGADFGFSILDCRTGAARFPSARFHFRISSFKLPSSISSFDFRLSIFDFRVSSFDLLFEISNLKFPILGTN